jgi:non-specific serine/threonine protein kinase/serine/threonine-protein kinase
MPRKPPDPSEASQPPGLDPTVLDSHGPAAEGEAASASDLPGDPRATVVDPGGRSAAVAGSPEDEATSFHHPERIGPFRIVNLLGEGGMGAVYLAEQSEPVERQIALKLVHASLRSPVAVARFTAERQAMARLSHPNVAQLYEAGTTEDGFPYFAMELVPGLPLTEHCDHGRLTVAERLALFGRVCRGVQHAHQKGILHRDLKPSNLLVAEVEGRPEPKVIDFGIAKAVDEPLTDESEPLTRRGAVGTPAYMSPEAIAGASDLDTRSDVYSLGIVLYELLTGVRPHQHKGPLLSRFDARPTRGEAERPSTRIARLDRTIAGKVAEKRQLAPEDLAKRIRGDLDWIVMKAIADEPDQRYASAAELATDIERHLADEPVEARPPTASYRLGKFVRRHRLAVAAATLVAVALILGIVGTSIGMVRAAREAEASRQVTNFLVDLFEVSDPGEARGNTVTARELLDEGARRMASELQDQPLLKARLMHTIGGVYENLGLYDQAAPLQEEALELRRASLGGDHPEVGRSLDALGNVYSLQANYQEAERLQRQAVSVLEQTVGPDHPDLAEALTHLALTSYFLDRLDEAESYYRRALAIREAALGPDHPDVAVGLAHLGFLYTNQERFEEAEPLLSRALSIRETTLGSDHFLVAESMDLLAELLFLQGRNEEAEDLWLRGLAVRQKVFEPDHPDLAESHFDLGRVYKAQSRFEEAESSFRRGLEIVETSLGPDHLNLSRGLQELGMMLADRGRWQESEATFRRLADVYAKALGSDHVWVGEALNNLGWVLSDGLGRYAEGEVVLRRAVVIFPADPEDAGFSSALARWSLANNLRDQGRYEDAEPFYEEALAILKAVGGSRRQDNPQLPELLSDYGQLLRATGRQAKADALEDL